MGNGKMSSSIFRGLKALILMHLWDARHKMCKRAWVIVNPRPTPCGALPNALGA